MPGFEHFIKQNQSAINLALEQAVSILPDSVREVAAYALLSGGKRLRPILNLICGRLLAPHKNDEYPLGAVLEMIHVASLLHDDVLDGAQTRRGKTSAHLKYGISPCLLAGDALMAQASRMVAGYGNTEMVDCLADAMLKTVAGEAQEIVLCGSLTHGQDVYLEIIIAKTAWMFRASCRLAALYAGADKLAVNAISDYGLNLGIAFQMVDDALDFADEAVTGKPTGGDLREGKNTPPISLYYNTLAKTEQAEFAKKFASGAFSEMEVESISKKIRAQGYDAQTRELANSYLRQAKESLAAFTDCPEKEMLLHALDFVRERKA